MLGTRFRFRTLARAVLVVAIASVALACQPNEPPTGDGLTSADAGASCWGIKQAFPASTDGVYWLHTPTLDRPTQFYCDMTTDGGGWVLVGRGRETWTYNPAGQGTAAAIRTTPTGPSAFAAAALSPRTIDALLDGAALDTLTDGIRIRRATNSTGTSWQDLRLFPSYDDWTWAFPSGQRLSGLRFDSTSYTNGNTRDTADDFWDYPYSTAQGRDGLRRMRTYASSVNGYRTGFAYGSNVFGGGTSSTNYLYRVSNGWVMPFSQVWLRPQIANDSQTWTPLPAQGLPAEVNGVDSLKNRPEVAPWGVVGLNHTNEDTITPWYTTVNVLEAYGSRVFVGGRFTGVQQGPNGAVTAQGSLAAFDLDGNWISTFRPTITGRVWDMTMTTDGKLIIGGDFTSVNGEPNTAGLAALDPQTGEVLAGWRANISHTTNTFIVRGLDSRGPWVYAVGRFNRVEGGGWAPQTVSNAVSIRATDGAPGSWKPVVAGTSVRVKASADGERVYFAGYFASVNGDTNHGYHAITDTVTGAPVPGMGPWQPSDGTQGDNFYQQAVAEWGDQILVGGSEHDFQIYDHDRNTLLYSTITKSGGDTQAIEVFGDDIYVGCHCDEDIFQGTNDWDTPRGFSAVDPIMQVGRFDATTHQYDTDWYPSGLKGDAGDGVWAVTQDQRGCVWVGGDLTRGATTGVEANDWLGGFGRFCPTDTTPPSAPTGLVADSTVGGVTLSWGAGADETSPVTYDVFRNNRVIATVSGTSFTDTAATGTVRYAVRAVDTSGNDSATTPVVTTTGPAPQVDQPVPFASTWSYLADGSDPGATWAQPGFDDSGWATGSGIFGWGTGTESTVLTTQPLTSHYRRSFTVPDVAAVQVLDLQLKVNAGAVAYVNGVEVGRINMPAGTITPSTPAASYICCAEEARIKQLTVPRGLLQEGTNTLAVELHAWDPAAGRAFFDLQATTLGPNGDTVTPTAPLLTLERQPATGTVGLSWTASSDNIGVAGYLVSRDGQPLASVNPQTTAWTDTTVTPLASHTYVVSAFDANGNLKASAAKAVTAPADPYLLAFGSTWRWTYPDTEPAGAWEAAAYDDSAWATGPGEFGFGDTPKATIISTAPTPRPLTSYYRRTIEVADPTDFGDIRLDLIRNSGAAVYVNGVEVARVNLPAGPLTADTFATSPIAIDDRHVPVPIIIPASALTPGTNQIAVELHLNSRNQATAGFDLAITGQP